MINLNFNIRNPWSDRWECIKAWSGKTVFKNKFWEAQIDKTSDIVGFEFRLTSRQDHAGLFLTVALFGYELIFNFYDNRHWNHETSDWEVYEKDTVL